MLEYFETAVYIFAVYHLIVALVLKAGTFRFRKQSFSEELPAVSIVVCARNEEHVVGKCLDNLDRLDYPVEKLDIVLVDDESRDATAALFHSFAEHRDHVRVLSTEGVPRTLYGKQRPLDYGLRHAAGDIILVTDADTVVKPAGYALTLRHIKMKLLG